MKKLIFLLLLFSCTKEVCWECTKVKTLGDEVIISEPFMMCDYTEAEIRQFEEDHYLIWVSNGVRGTTEFKCIKR